MRVPGQMAYSSLLARMGTIASKRQLIDVQADSRGGIGIVLLFHTNSLSMFIFLVMMVRLRHGERCASGGRVYYARSIFSSYDTPDINEKSID